MFEKLLNSVGLNTPRAPRKRTVPLPEMADAPDAVPPLVPSWASSASTSSGSPSPTTPSPRSSPVACRVATGGSRTPSDTHSVSRFSSPDPALDKARHRRTSTSSAPQIVKPTPRRAFAVPPLSTTVMHVEVPPLPAALASPPVRPVIPTSDAQKPIKGILKQHRPATVAPSQGYASPVASAAPAAQSASRPPSSSPPRAPGVGTCHLHWQLLPPPRVPSRLPNGQPTRTMQLVFDITKPLSCIRIRDLSESPPRYKSTDAVRRDLKKEACSVPLYNMTIQVWKYQALTIQVSGKGGKPICCEDILEAIFQFFDRVMTADDRCDYVKEDRYEQFRQAFLQRCENSWRAVPSAEKAKGHRFVDLLEGQTYFWGLRLPPGQANPSYWVVDFGPCP
ncbi:hypothetical protein C8Q73DRAFT_666812 [Cubamyces lactineus]|nr:hypothetical protein C8Q73DRAFT_666812 [Cubamyces lactineus]